MSEKTKSNLLTIAVILLALSQIRFVYQTNKRFQHLTEYIQDQSDQQEEMNELLEECCEYLTDIERILQDGR